MSTIPNEVVSKVSALQAAIWQTVSMTVSEAANQAITFANPLTVSSTTTDLASEVASPKLVIQFAFATTPENSQIVLIGQEALAELSEAIRGEPAPDIDDNLVTEIRPVIESIVQGICLAVGNVKNEPMVASGLSIRYQIFSFPPNIQKSEHILRTNVAITGEQFNGTAIWLLDSETAHYLVGVPMQEEDPSPFQQARPMVVEGGTSNPYEDPNSLDILMDIPLEISVELGRVKMLVKDVVDLGSGSIVEIDKAAGEPVDVLVNGRLVARGEVVVIEDNFGVRIMEILSPQERLNKLNEAA